MPKEKIFDVVIVGAGIAGCHLAQLLANHDMRVAVVDRKPLPTSGPHWLNAVPLWMFDEAGLARPFGQELFDLNDRFIIRSVDDKALHIDNLGLADVDMALLGKRLKANAFDGGRGIKFHNVAIEGAFCDQTGRLAELCGSANDKTLSFKSKVFVDASGTSAILRQSHPWAHRYWPKPSLKDLCSAAQRTLDINDRHGAEDFLMKNDCMPKDVMAKVGFLGGYSLFRWQIDEEMRHISILCGVRALPGATNAKQIVDRFVANNKWIGSHFIDGRGAIPLNAPYKQLIAPGMALLGDAACQVYAAHGSGIGIGLLAAKMLADVLVLAHRSDQDLGDMPVLSQYQQSFHRRFARRLKFSETVRRISEKLDQSQISLLIKSGLLNQSLAKQTLHQEEPGLPIGHLPLLVHKALISPQLFSSLLPLFARTLVGGKRT